MDSIGVQLFSMPTAAAEVKPPAEDIEDEPSLCTRICNVFKKILSWIVYVFTFGFVNTFEVEESTREDEVVKSPEEIQIETALKDAGLTEEKHPVQIQGFLLLVEFLDKLRLPNESFTFSGQQDENELCEASVKIKLPPSLKGAMIAKTTAFFLDKILDQLFESDKVGDSSIYLSKELGAIMPQIQADEPGDFIIVSCSTRQESPIDALSHFAYQTPLAGILRNIGMLGMRHDEHGDLSDYLSRDKSFAQDPRWNTLILYDDICQKEVDLSLDFVPEEKSKGEPAKLVFTTTNILSTEQDQNHFNELQETACRMFFPLVEMAEELPKSSKSPNFPFELVLSPNKKELHLKMKSGWSSETSVDGPQDQPQDKHEAFANIKRTMSDILNLPAGFEEAFLAAPDSVTYSPIDDESFNIILTVPKVDFEALKSAFEQHGVSFFVTESAEKPSIRVVFDFNMS